MSLHWQARFLDRRYLADLDWSAWQQTAEELQARLPDDVIDDAVKRLPPPYFRLGGAALAARLKSRRDGLGAMARRFYELLAREAEVHGTDGPDCGAGPAPGRRLGPGRARRSRRARTSGGASSPPKPRRSVST